MRLLLAVLHARTIKNIAQLTSHTLPLPYSSLSLSLDHLIESYASGLILTTSKLCPPSSQTFQFFSAAVMLEHLPAELLAAVLAFTSTNDKTR